MGALTVSELAATYVVPRDLADPAQVRQQLDSLLADRVPEIAAAELEAALPDDDTVWLLRRIDAEAAVDLARTAPELGSTIGRSIGTSVAAAIKRGPDGRNVVRFRDRAMYLARFLADHAGGNADSWMYRPLDPLPLLPVGEAVVAAAAEHRADAEGMLVWLDELGSLDVVTAAMSASDVAGLLGVLAIGPSDPPAAGQKVILQELIEAWRRDGDSGAAGVAAEVRALRAAVRLRRRGRIQSIGSFAPLILALPDVAPDPAGAAVAAASEASYLETDHGGVFWLLPSLVELWAVLRVVPQFEAPGSELRFGALLAALGLRPKAHDAVIAAIAGDPAAEPAPAAADAALATALHSFVESYRILGPEGFAIETSDDAIAVVDIATGLWLRLVPGTTPADLVSAIASAAGLSEASEAPLLLPADAAAAWVDAVREAGLAPWFPDEPCPDDDAARHGLSYLERRPDFDGELRYLTGGMGLSDHGNPAAVWAGQIVLRRWARRLGAFATGTGSYLAANLLETPATLERRDEEWVVTLQPPPLALVLRIAGLHDFIVAPDWLDHSLSVRMEVA